jgi:hypothetical protein
MGACIVILFCFAAAIAIGSIIFGAILLYHEIKKILKEDESDNE